MATAAVLGVGPGLGAALARRFARGGLDVALMAQTKRVWRPWSSRSRPSAVEPTRSSSTLATTLRLLPPSSARKRSWAHPQCASTTPARSREAASSTPPRKNSSGVCVSTARPVVRHNWIRPARCDHHQPARPGSGHGPGATWRSRSSVSRQRPESSSLPAARRAPDRTWRTQTCRATRAENRPTRRRASCSDGGGRRGAAEPQPLLLRLGAASPAAPRVSPCRGLGATPVT